MSKEAKNEIDLMLRQMGRRDDAVVYESDEQHLDADELNSYVANALPPAARARYIEHLADCASCRRLVAQLSAAHGPVVVASTGTIPAPSGLKHFLASLLSPMVLRYAVPALGVLVIMVVGFVVMRRPAQESVAKLMTNQPNGSVATPAPQSPSAPSAEGSPESKLEDGLVQNQRSALSPNEKPARGQVEKSGETAAKEQPSTVAVTSTEPTIETPTAQPMAKSAESVTVVPKAPAYQSGSPDAERRAESDKKAAEPPPPAAKTDSVEIRQREAQPKAAQTQVAGATTGTGAATNRASEVRRLSSADAKREGERNKQARDDEERDKMTAKDEDTVKEKNEAAAETRSVAGRRFRKSGNVWIDTAYKSSQQTFSVTRGSEQYRTLVGDEPEIRKIAEELDGEFIVVWKGRAYRIR